MVSWSSQKQMVSVRQKRKKKRPSRYLDSRKNRSRVGMVQEKKAILIIMPWPSRYMAITLTHSNADAPANPASMVVRQE